MSATTDQFARVGKNSSCSKGGYTPLKAITGDGEEISVIFPPDAIVPTPDMTLSLSWLRKIAEGVYRYEKPELAL